MKRQGRREREQPESYAPQVGDILITQEAVQAIVAEEPPIPRYKYQMVNSKGEHFFWIHAEHEQISPSCTLLYRGNQVVARIPLDVIWFKQIVPVKT